MKRYVNKFQDNQFPTFISPPTSSARVVPPFKDTPNHIPSICVLHNGHVPLHEVVTQLCLSGCISHVPLRGQHRSHHRHLYMGTG